jgi:hypothetical protein
MEAMLWEHLVVQVGLVVVVVVLVHLLAQVAQESFTFTGDILCINN